MSTPADMDLPAKNKEVDQRRRGESKADHKSKRDGETRWRPVIITSTETYLA